jgi:hypothetical protein
VEVQLFIQVVEVVAQLVVLGDLEAVVLVVMVELVQQMEVMELQIQVAVVEDTATLAALE